MKLSKTTIAILRNMSPIAACGNTGAASTAGILLRAGRTQTVCNIARNVMMAAEFDEEIPQDFGVYQVDKFLASLGLFEDPELFFHDSHVDISEGSQSVHLRGAAENLLVTPKASSLPLRNVIAKFTLGKTELATLAKGAAILESDVIRVTMPGLKCPTDDILISASPAKITAGNNYTIKLASSGALDEATSISIDSPITVALQLDRLHLLPGDYNVHACVPVDDAAPAYFQFSHKELAVNYWMAVDKIETK